MDLKYIIKSLNLKKKKKFTTTGVNLWHNLQCVFIKPIRDDHLYYFNLGDLLFLCVFLIEKKKKKLGDLPFQKRSKLTRLSFQKDRKKKGDL